MVSSIKKGAQKEGLESAGIEKARKDPGPSQVIVAAPGQVSRDGLEF